MVRHGTDYKHPGRDHTFVPVHCEMLLQIARDYPGLNPLDLTLDQIHFFYDGLRAELKKHTKPPGK